MSSRFNDNSKLVKRDNFSSTITSNEFIEITRSSTRAMNFFQNISWGQLYKGIERVFKIASVHPGEYVRTGNLSSDGPMNEFRVKVCVHLTNESIQRYHLSSARASN